MKHWFSHKEYKLADILYFKVTMEPKDKVFIIVGRQGGSQLATTADILPSRGSQDLVAFVYTQACMATVVMDSFVTYITCTQGHVVVNKLYILGILKLYV